MTERAVQDVCGQIALICRRLAEPWAASASNMNLAVEERETAVSNHSRLMGAAKVIETYQGHSGVEDRLADLDRRLTQIRAIVRFHERNDLTRLDNGQLVGMHRQFLDDLRLILK